MTHLTVSQRTLLGRTYQSAQAIASSGTTEGTDEFCRTIPTFRGKIFVIVQHFFLPKCGFPTYFIPPNRLSRHFRATTGVCDVARFQKTAGKWNRATFTGHRTYRNGRDHAIMAKNTSKAPLFIHFESKASPIGNRNRESRKRHHLVYASKEQLNFCICCFRLPKHETRLLLTPYAEII